MGNENFLSTVKQALLRTVTNIRAVTQPIGVGTHDVLNHKRCYFNFDALYQYFGFDETSLYNLVKLINVYVSFSICLKRKEGKTVRSYYFCPLLKNKPGIYKFVKMCL